MSSLLVNSSFHSLKSKIPSKFSMVSTYPRSRSCNLKIMHSMPQEKFEMFESLENWAEKNIVVNLKPIEQSWQPTDFLPDPSSDGFHEQVMELRERAKELPDDYFVTLVGHMVGEEALLPIYHSWLNSLDGTSDETGASLTPWAIWTRGWSAEENRHGDLLSKYLYLSGRVDMRQIEKTTHYMISSGMDFRTEHNPYLAFIYTSIQERATFTAHGNAARLAKQHAGDTKLAQLCGTIAADEKRHENAYATIVGKLFELDPDGTVLALANLLRKNVAHPAHMMYDGRDDSLFQHFSAVSSRIGVYGAEDYAAILEFFLGKWKVEELVGLSSEGRKAQDYVCKLSERMKKMVEKAQGKAKQAPSIPFGWIFDKQVKL